MRFVLKAHEYVPELSQRFSPQEQERMRYWHALPDDWQNMDYREFLKVRRELIASVIQDGYKLLSKDGEGNTTEIRIPIAELLAEGETTTIELKSTLRTNLHTGEKDPRMEMSVLKTIAAFLNTNGGSLVIGLADDGSPVGIEEDKFPNKDKCTCTWLT